MRMMMNCNDGNDGHHNDDDDADADDVDDDDDNVDEDGNDAVDRKILVVFDEYVYGWSVQKWRR